MLQRLTRNAQRSHEDSNSLPSSRSQYATATLGDDPNPPVVGRVDHHSIELSWEDRGAGTKGDKRLKYSLQEEDRKTSEFSTVYIGYANSYKVSGLDPLQSYKYRLKMSTADGDSVISPVVTVFTTREPYNGDHLHRATLKRDLAEISKIVASGDVRVDVNDKLGYTPLMTASQKGYLDVVELLLELHADVFAENTSGKNSIIVASFAGHEDVVRHLRDAGATWTCTDKGGSTPLHWAVDGINCSLIEWMIQDGAPVDIKDTTSGWTPLIRCAAVHGNEEVAGVLLKAGADVDCTDNDGKTALMIAALNGSLKMVTKLVQAGADVFKKSGHHKTALDMAQSFERRAVVRYLEAIVNPPEESTDQ